MQILCIYIYSATPGATAKGGHSGSLRETSRQAIGQKGGGDAVMKDGLK